MTRGEKFKQARVAAGFGLNELAAATGVNKAVISNWENSKRDGMMLTSALALAQKLGVSLEWIATGEGSPEGAGSLPASPADRARLAARALGYAPDVIDSALANPPADADARALFRQILNAENEKMAPAQEPKVLGTRKDVAEAGARPPDDALAAEEARQKAEADAKAKAEAKASAAPPPKGKKR